MIPIYEQIADRIKALIRDGELKENDGLPSVRALSKELRISGSGIEEATDVTISVKETTPSSTVFNATLASTEAGETSIAAGSQVTVAVTLPDDNSDMTVGGQPVEIPSESEIPEPEPNPYGFAGGSGTSADPYLIANASQFLKIGTQEFQTKLLEGDNDNLYFKLTGDIDLSNQTGGYAIPVFSGTLDGNGHVIKGSNNLDFIFAYFFEDTTFKNFTIELAESSVTRLFSGPSLLAESSFSGFEKGTSSGATNIYVYDKDTITLTIDDVDYKAYEGSYYAVGDDNYALYVTGNVDVMNVYYDGKFDTCRKTVTTNDFLLTNQYSGGEAFQVGIRFSYNFGNKKVKQLQQRNTSNSRVKDRVGGK